MVPDASALAAAIANGDRRALARAITLIESTRADHRAAADSVIAQILGRTGGAIRVAISGPPGAGKSSFIERFGLAGIARQRRIAVLAVDPASKRGGGAILGDKTRMAELACAPTAFIRPSSAGHATGGVARRTRETILLCEAAGFDTVLIETLGVGQAETAAAEIVDMLILVLPPAGGDELQGIKRGIVEIADLVLVNKADGELAASARRTQADYASALRLVRPRVPGWQVPVRAVSALTGTGVDSVWDDVAQFRTILETDDLWSRRRAEQAQTALWSEIGDGLLERFRAAPRVAGDLAGIEAEIRAGRVTPSEAARRLLDAFERE